jgi:hypothetical protein
MNRTVETGRLTTVFLTASFVGVLSGCEASGSAPVQVVHDTIEGVEHVISSGDGRWTQAGRHWQLSEIDRIIIGELEGEDEYVFGGISGVLVDAAGEVYVADPQARTIRVFSRDGAFLRGIGRSGEGPGEFRHISGLSLAPDGIAALDGSLNRVTIFSPSGEVVRTLRLERPYMVVEHYAPMAFDSTGQFYDRARLSRVAGVDSIGVVKYGRDGRLVSRTFLAEIQQDLVMLERNGMPYMSIPRPFAPHPSIALSSDGKVYLTRGDDYRIDVFSGAGDSVRAIRRTVQPQPVTEAERDSALAFIAQVFEGAGAGLPARTRLPDRKGAIAQLVVDAEGHLWVLKERERGATDFTWSVHDSAGRFLGTVSTPQMAVTQIGMDFVAGTVQDELGVARAVVIPLIK